MNARANIFALIQIAEDLYLDGKKTNSVLNPSAEMRPYVKLVTCLLRRIFAVPKIKSTAHHCKCWLFSIKAIIPVQ